jgi:methyl-accepting chemotaxis protein
MSTSIAAPPDLSRSTQPRPGLRLGLAPKLLGVVGLLALLAAGIATGAIHTGARQAEVMERLEGLGSRGIILGRANVNFVSWVRGVEFLPLELSAEDRQRWEATATDQMQRLEKRLDEVRPALTLPESRRDLVKVEAAIASYRKVHAEVQALARAGKLDEATRIAMAAAAEVEATGALLREMQLRVVRTLDALKLTARDETASTQAWLIGGSLAGILLGTGLALLVVLRGVTGPLKRLTATAGALAEGRIDTPVEATGRADEVGAIARGLEVLRHGALRTSARSRPGSPRSTARRRARRNALPRSPPGRPRRPATCRPSPRRPRNWPPRSTRSPAR